MKTNSEDHLQFNQTFCQVVAENKFRNSSYLLLFSFNGQVHKALCKMIKSQTFTEIRRCLFCFVLSLNDLKDLL